MVQMKTTLGQQRYSYFWRNSVLYRTAVQLRKMFSLTQFVARSSKGFGVRITISLVLLLLATRVHAYFPVDLTDQKVIRDDIRARLRTNAVFVLCKVERRQSDVR